MGWVGGVADREMRQAENKSGGKQNKRTCDDTGWKVTHFPPLPKDSIFQVGAAFWGNGGVQDLPSSPQLTCVLGLSGKCATLPESKRRIQSRVCRVCNRMSEVYRRGLKAWRGGVAGGRGG